MEKNCCPSFMYSCLQVSCTNQPKRAPRIGDRWTFLLILELERLLLLSLKFYLFFNFRIKKLFMFFNTKDGVLPILEQVDAHHGHNCFLLYM